MIIRVDIDGTIATLVKNADYDKAEPIQTNIDKINKLYDEGNTIIYWTARGATSGKDWFMFTYNQLEKWGCKFHKFSVIKPYFDLLIDDKTKRIEEI